MKPSYAYDQSVLDAFVTAGKLVPTNIWNDIEADRYKYLTDVTLLSSEKKSGRFLDVGGASGANCMMLKQLGEFDLYIVDHFDGAKTENNPTKTFYESQGISVQICDVSQCKLPYVDDYFDLISAVDIIEHFSCSAKQFLDELKRVLKPDGKLLFGCPNISHLQNRFKTLSGLSIHSPISDWHSSSFKGHVREYTKTELLWLLDQSGFKSSIVRMGEEELLSVLKDKKKLQRQRVKGGSTQLDFTSPAQLIFYTYAFVYFMVVRLFPNLRYFIRIVSHKKLQEQ